MKIEFQNLTIIFIISAGIIAAFLLFLFFNHPNTTTVSNLENTPFYDRSTQSIVLTNNSASFSSFQSCDIYVVGPNGETKYFQKVDCVSLSSTEISKQNILNSFNGLKGIYKIIVATPQNPDTIILQFVIS